MATAQLGTAFHVLGFLAINMKTGDARAIKGSQIPSTIAAMLAVRGKQVTSQAADDCHLTVINGGR